jgi:Phage integrase, N-terminal SAM-like domain
MAFTRQVQGPGRAALRPVDIAVGLPPLKSVRLLDQLRERIRLLHYSLRVEEANVYQARAYSRFHGVRHPAEMGEAVVEGFLTHLAPGKNCLPRPIGRL